MNMIAKNGVTQLKTQLPAWHNLELVKLKPENPPTVLYQGPDAQSARRRPDDNRI